MTRRKTHLIRGTVAAAALAAFWGFLVLFENSLIFFPSSYPAGSWDIDAVARGRSVTIEDCFFDTDDGLRLNGWWVRGSQGKDDENQPVVIFFHGNAGNLSDRAGFVFDLTRLGVEVFAVDYRGYGRSEGRSSESGIYLDAVAAWEFLTTAKAVPTERIVLFGKSLGGAAAIDLATRVQPAGIVVQSSFTSVPDMALRHYPFVPRFLIRTRMDNLAKMDRIACPVLVIHSTGDEVVPFTMGRKLFDSANQPKTFFEIKGAGHNETIAAGGQAYFHALGTFIRGCNTR